MIGSRRKSRWDGDRVAKESFVFYVDWIEHLSMLDPPEVILVLKEIQAHMDGKSTGRLSGAAAMAFSFIRAQLDRDLEKWDEIRKNRSEAGKRGANATNNRQKSAKSANADFDEQKSAKPAVPVPVPVPVNIIESKVDKPPRPRFVPPSVSEVEEYCREKGYGIDAEVFVAYYEANGWRVGKNPMKSWKSAVVTWAKRSKGYGEKPEPVVRAYEPSPYSL